MADLDTRPRPSPALDEGSGWRSLARTRHRNPVLVFALLLVLGTIAVVLAFDPGGDGDDLSTGPGGDQLARYLPLPGDQAVLVPDGTYRGGEITAAHPETSGPYRGWLVLVAESRHGVVVDLAEEPLVLEPGTSRILFVGFRFVNGTVTVKGASDIAFWHTDHTFPAEGWAAQLREAGGDRAALREIPHFTPTAVRIQGGDGPARGIGMYGSDIHDVGDDGIIMNSLTDGLFQGLRIWDVEEGDHDPGFNPNPDVDDLIHNDSIQATGAVHRVDVRDSYLGQAVQWGAQAGSIRDTTFERLWIADSQGVGLINDVFPGFVLTGATREIRAWGNGRSDPALDRFRLDIQGESRAMWPETLATAQLQVPANVVLDGDPPDGVEMAGRRMVDERQALEHEDNPAVRWRQANPYGSWRDFFDFPPAAD